MDINRAWEKSTANIKILAKDSLGYYELRKHKSWFDEGCSKLLDQRKQATLQSLNDPSEINVENLKNIRREASKHFKNKKGEYLRDKLIKLAINSKNKNRHLYRGIKKFKTDEGGEW
jgi:hypothetical protein